MGVAVDGELVSVTAGRTRDETIDHLLDGWSAHPETVVGLDFSFSFPSWFVADHGLAPWDLAAERGPAWLASCPPPFWGRPGRRRSLPPEQGYRRTELSLSPRPGSIFQIGGAGSVGTASLRGMPHLRRLADAGVAVWPFADWDNGRPVVAEVWPRSVIGRVVKSSRTARAAHLPSARGVWAPAIESDDAFDAACAAIALSRSSAPAVELDATDRIEGRVLTIADPVAPRGGT